VKKEDLDWWIYHILADEPDQDISALSEKTCCNSGEVAESLERLERIFLVEQCDDKYRIRSIHEMLLTCQARYDESTPFIIENGIIRERKRPG
jgi:DNA-binding IclR family transcriptional regulator